MKKYILLVFIFSTILFSCSKENTYLTQGQLTALRMEKDFGIGANGVATFGSIFVYSQLNNSVISTGFTSAKVTSDGYLILSGQNVFSVTYNLEQLKSYSISPTSNLALYF